MPATATREVPPELIATSGYSALKAVRETRGYSVEELSLTCGLSVHEIADIENGKDADPSKLRRIALALQVPESVLIDIPTAENQSMQ
ncbi:helix-turn-helix domain-containing protein [Mesorhizobium amorphae]|uniref:helix-turn-helix domain-containing protein n=1 Tax=Mesorhizobium amorphae TaxID=71433 RepID=UPI00177ED493|nr:helix-turn-helix transcriptional regulator [Mesorhizobium amorphae]